MSELSVRPANQSDIPFIFATWLKSYRDSKFAELIDSKTYFAAHHALIEILLAKSTVLIAFPTNQPNVICGWSVTQPNLIHYVYTKSAFQKLGVATSLLKSAGIDLKTATTFTHGSKAAKWFAPKFQNLTYNPYAL
jgi:hypothetical protein